MKFKKIPLAKKKNMQLIYITKKQSIVFDKEAEK